MRNSGVVAAAIIVSITIMVLVFRSLPSSDESHSMETTIQASPVPLLSQGKAHILFPDGSYRDVTSNSPDKMKWWLDVFPTWHHDELNFMLRMMESGRFSSYVGFGEWIGPTALQVAPHVARTFAIEPDPLCLVDLRANVALNPSVAATTFVSSLCISSRVGQLVLRGSGASGSFLEDLVSTKSSRDYAKQYAANQFPVTCITLDVFFAEHQIDPSTAFVKVDTEGAEWSILPSLRHWLSSMAVKPTLLVSPHANDQRSQFLEEFAAIVHMYRFASLLPAGGVGSIAQPSQFMTREVLSTVSRDFILADFDPFTQLDQS